MSAFERLQKIAEEKRQKEKIEKPKLEVVPKDDTSLESEVGTVSQPGTASQPSTARSVSTPNTKNFPIAPEKDFQKVANSVIREVGQGIFKGKSKQMYDYLYSLTRGAINPKRTVRISKPKLMRGTGIGSPQTFYRNISHLESLGLIRRKEIVGEAGGNEYEVFLPEEVNPRSVHSVQSVQSDRSAYKQVVPVLPETELTDFTLKPTKSELLDMPKTSFKDNTKNDDEAFAEMLQVLIEMTEKATGKTPTKNQRENWKQLAELMAMEMEIAAARTKLISNVPAFLTEHLRRRLIGKANTPKSTAGKSKVNTTMQVGKTGAGEAVEEYQAEPLSEDGRQTVLKSLQSYIDKEQKEFVLSFQDSYTEEDWQWLMQNLQFKESEKEQKVKD